MSRKRWRRWRVSVATMVCGLALAGAGARAEEPFRLAADLPVVAPRQGVSVAEPGGGAFRERGPGPTSLGVTAEPRRFRFVAVNPTAEAIDWVFNLPHPQFDEVDLRVSGAAEGERRFALGDKRPAAARPLPGEGFAVPITTAPGATTTVEVTLHNREGDGLDSYFEVASPRAHAAQQFAIAVFLGALLGGMLVLWLYNAVVWLVVRDGVYGWYLLYLSGSLLTYVTVSGLGAGWLWSHEGVMTEAVPPLASALTFAAIVQFSRRFLETRRNWPWVDRGLRLLAGYFVLPPLAYLAGRGDLAAMLVMVGCLGLGILPVLGILAWRRGQRTALVFALAWGVWFAGFAAMIGRFLGFLPTNDFTLRIGWIGILGEAVCFALALALRIRALERQKEAAEQRERALLLRAKDDLEAEVRSRTAELAAQSAELQRLNRDKDRLFSIVAHDLRNPFAGVVGITDLLAEEGERLSAEERRALIGDLTQSTRTFQGLLDHLLTWALVQLGGMRFAPRTVDLPALVARCAAVFEPALRDKRVNLALVVEAPRSVVADESMLEVIVRNLLGNAIKYSHPGGRVAVSTASEPEGVVLRVTDDGVGMSAEQVEALLREGNNASTPGTQNEAGTGLGLTLCRELIERHGGRLTVRSVPGAGTTVEIRWPGR